MTLQEPENPERKTGSNLPAPELLKDVLARTPMVLADFEAFADANNPTLKQANAFVRRSQEQARQAGLCPNPSVGYQGEQFRGGCYGGGEQGETTPNTAISVSLLGPGGSQRSKNSTIGVANATTRSISVPNCRRRRIH
jgi:cobalt-zinc-cadmium efflux system outer membrane protein